MFLFLRKNFILTPLFLTFSFIHIALAETPKPRINPDSCAFYDQLGDYLNCPESDAQVYLKDYGGRYCNDFLAASKKWGPALSQWRRKTARCLQEMLLDNESRTGRCPRLASFAFDTHSICYKEGGFCELSTKGKFQILNVITPQDLKTGRSLAQTLSMLSCWIESTSTEERATLSASQIELARASASAREYAASYFSAAPIDTTERRIFFSNAYKAIMNRHSIRLSSEQVLTHASKFLSIQKTKLDLTIEEISACLKNPGRCH